PVPTVRRLWCSDLAPCCSCPWLREASVQVGALGKHMETMGGYLIADTRLREEVPRFCRALLDLPPNLSHIQAQVMSVFGRIGSPYVDQELPVRNDLSGAAHEPR